ncbi:MAG: hypothetical protein AB7S99_00830 [Pseudodonghicola sp.]
MTSPVPALCFCLTFAFASMAYGSANGGTDGSTGGGMGGGGMGGGGASAGLSARVTKQVTHILQRDFDGCRTLQPVHRYDCYRQTYKLAIDQIAGLPAYRPAQQALKGVETALEQIVARNADPAQRPAHKGLRSYRAIKPAAVPQATRELSQALEEAETKLLRSAAAGNTHFARIAQAVNSNKVLLRSALLRLLRPLHAVFA